MINHEGCFKNNKYHSEDRVNFYTMLAVYRGKVYVAVINGYEKDGEYYELHGYTVDGVGYPLDGIPYCIFVE